MLTAYFDDSGTHQGAEIVLVAGLAGTQGEIFGLEGEWRKLLQWPLDGRKPALKRFHMYDCQNSREEFSGWTRAETDYFRHQLEDIIVESGVIGYGMACVRKDWDELVTGDLRAFEGNPEGQCIRNCFVRILQWAQRRTFDPEITFIFDNRPQDVQRDARAVFDIFRSSVRSPSLRAISFLSSSDALPLQAADMLMTGLAVDR
jgi:hypothetical protein